MPRLTDFSSKNKRLILLSTALFTAVLGSSDHVLAQIEQAVVANPGSVISRFWKPITVRGVLAEGRHSKPGMADPQVMGALYAQNDFETLWTDFNGPNHNALSLIRHLDNARQHGLNPAHYHVREIKALQGQYGFQTQAELEIYLTSAFLKYAQDLSGMRIDPAAFNLDAEQWRQKASMAELASLLKPGMDMTDVFAQVEPQGTTYQRLKAELAALMSKPRDDFSHILPIKMDGIVRPGHSHEAIKAVRTRLGLPQPQGSVFTYDDALAAAVMEFQRVHGLNADGVLGPNTIAALNHTDEDKILQLIATLEHMRWVKPGPSDYVVVNIPAATLWAVDDGAVALEMPVIVGNPARPTETFVAEIRGVRLNPTWTVPPTIKRHDIWPKVKDDPEYLLRTRIEIFDGYGPDAVSLDPLAIEWDKLSTSELHQIRMVQTPGPHNPLGEYRVLMDNKFNIYLHDTNQKEMFNNSDPSVSSGCIRLKDPRKLADFIMRGTGKWARINVEDVIATRKTTDILAAQPMPVYLIYQTVWVNDDGGIVYGDDLYGKDRKLLQALKNIDGYEIPVHTIEIVSSNPL